MQVAPRASSRGTSLANRDSLHPDQKNSSKVAGLAVDGAGGGRSRAADDDDEAFAFRLRKGAAAATGGSFAASFVLVVKHPNSLTM